MSAPPSVSPVPTRRVGTVGTTGCAPLGDPAALASTWRRAKPLLTTIERPKPELAVSVCISAVNPELRALLKASWFPSALGASRHAASTDSAPAEDRSNHVVRARPGLGDDRRRTGADEARRVVVDPLLGLIERPLGKARLGIAAGVAQVIEEHDSVLCELDFPRDRCLAEVLMAVVAAARDGVQSEAVLADGIERIAIAARPAVAVAHVDRRGTRSSVLRSQRARSHPGSRARRHPGCICARPPPLTSPLPGSGPSRRPPVRR